MELIAVFRGLASHMQLPMLFAQPQADGELLVLFGNDAANILLNWPDDAWPKLSLSGLLPGATAREVESWLKEPSSWRNAEAKRPDGTLVPVGVSVAEVKDADERAVVVFLRDRTESVRHEQELQAAADEATRQRDAAESARAEADTARNVAETERARAEQLAKVAEEARRMAELDAFNQRRLSVQTDTFKTIYHGTIGLVIMLAALVVFGWITNKLEKDSLAMFERILLVLTGMLGTAVASIFDARRGSLEEPKK